MVNLSQSFKELLKENGFKLTTQRRAVLDVILENQGTHLNTEEIYRLVKEKCPEIGLATVYRTMNLLEKMGLVYKLNMNDGCNRYGLNQHKEELNHHHLICLKCGCITEVEEVLLDSLKENIYEKYGFEVRDHRVKFFGCCKKCRQ